MAELNVAVQRIRDYLLSEECRLPPRRRPERLPTDSPKKRVTILEEPLRRRERSRRRNPERPGPSQNKPKEENGIMFV